MTKIKEGIFSIILLLFGLLVGLLGGEILVRFFAPQIGISPCITYDFNQAFIGKKNCTFQDNRFGFYDCQIKTNDMGLRMGEIEAGKINVLSVGDSYTFGWGVDLDQSYYGLLQQKIADSTAQVQLINGAVPGYSTGHIYVQMERLSKLFSFKKVIYFMCSNDISDNVRTENYYQNYNYSINENGNIELSRKQVYTPFRRFLFQYTPYEKIAIHSQLFHFIRGFFQKNPASKVEKVIPNPVNTDLLTKVSMAHLRNLYQQCQRLNAELMVVWIPAPEELNLTNKDKWNRNYDYKQFKRLAKTYLERGSASYFDPLDEMNRVLNEESADLTDYFIPDQHFNEAGYRLFYEAIEGDVYQFINQ
jgi:lysophospholipase L1-like esterase